MYVARWSGMPALAMILVLAGPASAQEAKQNEEIDLNDLSLEVSALQALHSFNFTDAQLHKLQSWAKETAAKPSKREPAKASKEYRDKLMELRDALVEATDDDKIDQLNEELEELREAQKPVVDDGVDLTPGARKRAAEALRLLKVQQFASYVAAVADDLHDPLERFLEAMQTVRGLKGNDWKQRREEIVDDILRLAAGVDSKKADKLTDQLTALLSRAHSMKDAEFKAKRQDLEKSARKLLGDLNALDVVRNYVEYGLAELLSNPRLTVALAARLKNVK
jgi:hypothetical protein